MFNHIASHGFSWWITWLFLSQTKLPPMTVESLKSELQQVLDNDLILRKEFNELKRSLSDYRNQLIMRDEDCKRLQVTIDVLNTKLVVMERDNNNYKAELTSFKELRSTIKDQLQEKQNEIDERLSEIQSLRDELNQLAAGYENKIEAIKADASDELNRVKEDYNTQLSEMKAVAAYKEQAIKEEYENRLNDLNAAIANKEQNFEINFQEQLSELQARHDAELSNLTSGYELKLRSLTDGSREEIDSLISTNQQTISELQNRFNNEREQLESNYVNEIAHLRTAIEEQRQTLTGNFNHQVEALKSEYESREEKLIANYESQITSLNEQLSGATSGLNEHFQKELADLAVSHQNILAETKIAHDLHVNTLINEYEEKLSVTLIHSNSQNSKLNEELAKAVLQNEQSVQQIQELTISVETKSAEVMHLGIQLSNLENQLNEETAKFNYLNNEFEDFKVKALMGNSEQVNELNSQIESLQLNHQSEIEDLKLQIENQSNEISNLGLILEASTNQLGLNESELESRSAALLEAQQRLQELEAGLSGNQLSFENEKALLVESHKKEIEAKNLEFQKLLSENANLISEIEDAQLQIESKESELGLIKVELDELKAVSFGKTEEYKEILANKNFEVTNLEAGKAALAEELVHAKMEILNLENALQNARHNAEMVEELSNQVNQLLNERDTLQAELSLVNEQVRGFGETINGLNEKIAAYDLELENMKAKASQEDQEAFIDRLFKQIDGLNDERLLLLEEKEQMANQLLKMNEVVSNISQHVDSEKINVTDLNNHRKNVILATNSNDQKERSEMKEQINDLVREIDKCIALLSA